LKQIEEEGEQEEEEEEEEESEEEIEVPVKKGKAKARAEPIEIEEVPVKKGKPNWKAKVERVEEDVEMEEVKGKSRVKVEPAPVRFVRPTRPTGVYYKRPCERCRGVNRECEKDEGGGACVTCKRSKYKCDYSIRNDQSQKRKKVETEDDDDEVVVVEGKKGKGKKRQADPPAKVKKEKKEEPKPTPRPKKVKTQPKSRQYVPSSSEEAMESEVEEPRPKRPRTRQVGVEGKFLPFSLFYFEFHFLVEFESNKQEMATRLADLESQMVGLMHGAEESKRTATRVEALESQVSRIAGPLEKILNSIQIDDHLRLVPETRRIAPPHKAPAESPPSPMTSISMFLWVRTTPRTPPLGCRVRPDPALSRHPQTCRRT
jgi:hypothetical protein